LNLTISLFNKKGKNFMGTFTLTGVNYTAEDHTPLWTGIGRDGRVFYSSDAVSWAGYTSPAGESADYWDISFGADSGGNDQWIIATNTTPELRKASDPTTGVDSWSSIDFTGSTDLSRTIEYGANGTWIAGTGGDVHRSTDGGTNWTKITNVASGAGAMYCLATDGAGVWMIGGSGTSILKSYDDGLNWYVSGTNVGQVNGIEYNNGVWFLASNTTTSYRATSIAQSNTTDTWSAVTGISVSLWAVCHVTGNTWMTAKKASSPVYLSTDNCASWSAVTNPSVGQVMGLASDGTTIVVCGKDMKVQTSTDNGTTWTQRYTSDRHLLGVEYNKVKPF
jgi:hypothetical protein